MLIWFQMEETHQLMLKTGGINDNKTAPDI